MISKEDKNIKGFNAFKKLALVRYFIIIAFLSFRVPECFSQSIVEDFRFYSYGRDKITSYHRNVFGLFHLSSNYLKSEENTFLFELDFTDGNGTSVYHLENSYKTSLNSRSKFSIGRNGIHLGTGLKTWSSRHPNLYYLKIGVTNSNNKLDTLFSKIVGIRDLYWVENSLIVNQEDSVLKAFEVDTLISDLQILQTAKSVFANSLFFNYLPSKAIVEKCDSLGIYLIINTGGIKSTHELRSFLDANHNSPSLVGFYQNHDVDQSDSLSCFLKEYRNFILLDRKPKNVIQSPFKINELSLDRIQFLKRLFNPFRIDFFKQTEDSIAVDIYLKGFGSFFNTYKIDLYFSDLEGANFDSKSLNDYVYFRNKIELRFPIPAGVSFQGLSKIELELYPYFENYWFDKEMPIIQLDIY